MPGARAWAPVVAVLQWAVDVKGYPANNWQNAPSTDRYRDAFARHFAAWQDDPRGVDAESGLSHLSHAVCNGLFLLWHGDDKPAQEATTTIDAASSDPAAVARLGPGLAGLDAKLQDLKREARTGADPGFGAGVRYAAQTIEDLLSTR
jgi:hypothetical protein